MFETTNTNSFVLIVTGSVSSSVPAQGLLAFVPLVYHCHWKHVLPYSHVSHTGQPITSAGISHQATPAVNMVGCLNSVQHIQLLSLLLLECVIVVYTTIWPFFHSDMFALLVILRLNKVFIAWQFKDSLHSLKSCIETHLILQTQHWHTQIHTSYCQTHANATAFCVVISVASF